MKPDVPELTDQIFAALHGVGTWRHFLDSTRRLLPNGQAYLFYHDAGSGAGAFPLSAGTDDAMVAAYNRHYSTLNPWMPHAAQRPLGRVVQADTMLPRADLAETEFYNDYLKPQDIHTGVGVTIQRDGGINFLFSVLCADTDAAEMRRAIDRLEALVPTLREAFTHYRRGYGAIPGLEARSARPGGTIRIGPDYRVLSADDAAIRIANGSRLFTVRPFSRFACKSEALTAHIQAVLRAWGRRAGAPPARVFHLFRDDGGTPLRVTAFRPAGPGDIAYFRGPECIIVIDDPAEGIEPAIAEMAGRFRLTAAERRLLGDLARGMVIDDIARHRRISRNTIKTQLKHIYAKTGLDRQSDLVRVVALMAGGRSAEAVLEAADAAREEGARSAPAAHARAGMRPANAIFRLRGKSG